MSLSGAVWCWSADPKFADAKLWHTRMQVVWDQEHHILGKENEEEVVGYESVPVVSVWTRVAAEHYSMSMVWWEFVVVGMEHIILVVSGSRSVEERRRGRVVPCLDKYLAFLLLFVLCFLLTVKSFDKGTENE